jgi:prepilin-type processing-associated H-X9-DG protein
LRKLDYLTDYGVYVCPEKKTPKGTTGPITDNICDYVYIGGFNEFDNSNTPLAFDKPGNSKDYFNVLFIDGHAERYSTSTANSCETIIIFLNEKFKYPEKLYKRLLEKAKKIDAELKSSN